MKPISLLVEFSDGDSFITKFNGSAKEAVKYYQKNNTLVASTAATIKNITVLDKSTTTPVELNSQGNVVISKLEPCNFTVQEIV